MTRSDTYEFWKEPLITTCKYAQEAFAKYVTEGSIQEAKMKILFCIKGGRYLPSHIAWEEKYDKDEECIKLGQKILNEALEEAMQGNWSEAEKTELNEFLEECKTECKTKDELYVTVNKALAHIQDADVLKEADELAKHWLENIRMELCNYDFRRDLIYQESDEGSDPPPWLDEFEYIDWNITH